jgi:DNA polymerase-1
VDGDLEKQKKLDGYLQKCVDMAGVDGRIHPATDVLKAAHGRDAMADPPLHQFPAPARGIVLFDEDGTSTDWSQQEPRMAMNLAGDIGAPLLDYERDGIKIYQGIADYADITMKTAKVVVLAGLYGEGLAKLSADLGLPPDPWVPEEVWNNGRVREAHWGYEAAKDVQQAVFSAIPATYQFMQDGKQIARDHQVAYTVAGRIIPIPSGFYKGKFSVQAHKWINYCVSGSANDEISRAIVTARRAGMGHLVWIGMHDELVHATRISREIQHIMQTPSERFCRLAKRVPVIRTDQEFMGKRWVKPE